ncbi:MAG: ABC transporter permease subunit, partial [Rhodoglobus sp.]|nr:ABC transporter permease subunit [Rhodoglobus sp.]
MDVIFGNLDLWGEALKNTLIIFFGGGLLALILGIIVGAARVSPVPIARGVGTVYVNLIRNTPLTLVFFFFIFGYPQLGLPKLSTTVLGILA